MTRTTRGRKRTSRAKRRAQSQAAERRRHQAILIDETPLQGDESYASAAYTQGRAVRYTYRIKGPTFPIVVTNINDDT